MNATPAPSARSRHKTLLNLSLAALGSVLLLLTVRRVGWSDVQSSLTSLGWWFVLVVALGGARFAARARAWQLCADSRRLGLGHALSATLAGDALGNLTPLGLLASEPAKVYFVRNQLPVVAAVASVAAENAFYVASVLVMIGAGAVLFFERAALSGTLQVAARGVLLAVMLGGAALVWVARRQPAILSRLARTLAAWTGRAETAPDRLRELEVHFYALLTWPAPRIARIVVWEIVFHAAATFEVWMVLHVIAVGLPPTLLEAFILETTGRLIVVAFKFVPYRLGVDEAGTALVARALALDPALGVTLALVRRLRIVVWNGVGLLLLARAR